MINKPGFNLYMESLRLERWPRTFAIIPGFIAFFVFYPHLEPARNPNTLELSIRLFIALLLTFFISIANYIVNEITDAPYDRHHPLKKKRPLVSGAISHRVLIFIWISLVTVSVATGIIFFDETYHFVMGLLALLTAGILYNVPPFRLKDIPYLDSTIEAVNNPIRFLIGWSIVGENFPPVILLASWWAFGNFLMVGKRVAEKKFLGDEISARYRIALKKYQIPRLEFFMIFNAIVFLITFSWFAIQSRYISFLFSIPFLGVYLFMFFKKYTQEINGAEDPEILIRNPYFAFYTLFLIAVFLLAYIIH